MTIDPRDPANDTETIARHLAAEAGLDYDTLDILDQAHWICCEANPYIVRYYDEQEREYSEVNNGTLQCASGDPISEIQRDQSIPEKQVCRPGKSYQGIQGNAS